MADRNSRVRAGLYGSRIRMDPNQALFEIKTSNHSMITQYIWVRVKQNVQYETMLNSDLYTTNKQCLQPKR